jgi:hypothetical protein
MADIITGTTTGFVNNTQDSILSGVHESTKETVKAGWTNTDVTKDARHDVIGKIDASTSDLSKQVDAIDDTLTAQASNYFIAGQQYAFQNARDVAALKATTDMGMMKLGSEIATQGALAQAASALESAKVASAVALGQAMLSKEIFADGTATRALINDLKYHDLNRGLIERNAELTEARYEGRHWRDRAEMSQFAAVNSQIQALHSQLSTQLATQGTVNFGSMSGNAGRNTSTNNVV